MAMADQIVPAPDEPAPAPAKAPKPAKPQSTTNIGFIVALFAAVISCGAAAVGMALDKLLVTIVGVVLALILIFLSGLALGRGKRR
jgi:predicted MFS family arabinose efflux permease